ncbi:MAG: aldo/keto reductase, partial [SAR202 cluster bacterium]|nr:aldo/keto reductase [SAR202 cluster bacterium]
AIKGRRADLFLTSKVSGADHSAQHIQQALDSALKSLGTDYIDLYQLHSPQPKWPIQETMSHLLQHRDAGKIRYIGVSNFSPDQIAEATKHGPVHSSQPRYSMLFRDEGQTSLPFCLKNGIGVMAFSPMAKGLLSGQYKPGHVFPPDDERHSWPFFQGEEFARIYAFTEKLKVWAADHGRDLSQLAIAWTLAHPAVTTSIVGARTPEQSRHNARAGDWQLTPRDLREIDELQGSLRLSFRS